MNARQKIKKLKQKNESLLALLENPPFNEPIKNIINTYPSVKKYMCRIDVRPEDRYSDEMCEEIAVSKFLDVLKQNLTYRKVYENGMYPCYEVSVYIGREE